MAEIIEKSFPFDSVEVNGKYDREYVADDFARYFRAFISSGVFMRTSTNLQVIANRDMTVTLKAGRIIIEGYRYELVEDLVLQLDPADGVTNRIDRVCITWSKSDRDIHYTVQKGTLAHEPVAVSVRRTAEYKDYAVADIYVAAGVISLTQTAITDQRLNSEVCGLATPFADFDTTTLYNKIEAYYAEMQKKTDAWTQEEQAEFTAWFNQIKDQLSGDIGANLQLQIGVLKSLTTKDKTSLVAAINEINDPLDTMEAIEANTDAGRFAGALAMKELNSNLNDSLSDKKIATLWEHPNFRDTSNLPNFAPQTLSIANLGNYDIIGICNSCYDRTRSRFNFVPNIPNKEQHLDSVWSSDSNGYEFCAYYRKFTISNDGITFDAGYSVRPGIRAKSNDYAIPIKIIGIKLI